MSLISKRRSPSEGASDASSQDQFSTLGPSSRNTNKSQIRHRASVACASCRERRIRCVVPEGETDCTQCKRSGAECVIKNDDERRRPISKAYMSSLSSRIALLEGMLQERGVVPPPAIHPPKTRHNTQSNQCQTQQQARGSNSPKFWDSNLVGSPEADSPTCVVVKEEYVDNQGNFHDENADPNKRDTKPLEESILVPEFDSTSGHNRDTASRLEGNLSHEDMPWQHPFYGPTSNIHLDAATPTPSVHGPREHHRRAGKFIQALSPSTKDHLMSCFWLHYNPADQVVDQQAFEADQGSPKPTYYTPLLHLTLLAAGYRFADRSREAVKRLTLGNWESTLHRESKSLLDLELERPTGVTTVQALLILADLEFGAGRDTTGWLYSGTANRLAFAMGLHIMHTEEPTTDAEGDIKRQVMTACVMFDRRWALLLGRPTSIKNQDLGSSMSLKMIRQSPSTTAPGVTSSESRTTSPQTKDELIHQHLVDLMGLAAKIADSQNTAQNMSAIFSEREAEINAYLHAVTLDQQLQSWYHRLPGQLSWTPINIKTAPFTFFTLHQQYHTCMILLYRPWARYGAITPDGINTECSQSSGLQNQTTLPKSALDHGLGSSQSVDNDSRTTLSRRMCTQHAVRVARIFWHLKDRRLDGSKINISGIQHAETSALALMAALAHQTLDLDHRSNLSYLNVLSTALYDMSRIYQPASRVYQLLKSILADIRTKLATSPNVINAHRMQMTPRSTPFGMSTGWRNNSCAEGSFSTMAAPQQTSFAPNEAMFQPSLFKKRRLGAGSRRSSEVALPTSSFIRAANDYWLPDSASSRLPLDASKYIGLGKRARPYSFDDIEVSANSSPAAISEDLSGELDFDFLISSPTVVDIAELASEEKKAATPEVAGDEGDNNTVSAVFEVVSQADNTTVSPGNDDHNHDTVNEHPETNKSKDTQEQDQQPTNTDTQTSPNLKDNDPKDTTFSESADATIEEWLAEPPGLTPTSLYYDTSTAGSGSSPSHLEDSSTSSLPNITVTTPPNKPLDTHHHHHHHATLAPSSSSSPHFIYSSGPAIMDSDIVADGIKAVCGGGDLESWMAAAFGINSDGSHVGHELEHVRSVESVNPTLSLSELVRSVERAVGGTRRGGVGVDGRDGKKGGDGMGVGAGVVDNMKGRGLKALDYLEL